MNRKVLLGAFVVAVALCLGGSSAWAQKSSVVQIPFVFTAGGQELPAGRYTIKPNENGNGLIVHNVDRNETTNVPVITRLSQRPATKVQMVFDKTQDKSYLTEVYFPGMDGFHLQGAPGKHAHAQLEAK